MHCDVSYSMSSSKQHGDEANLCKFFYILAKKKSFLVKALKKRSRNEERTFTLNLDLTR